MCPRLRPRLRFRTFARGIRDLCGAACIWRDICEEADLLARDGLAFLKQQAGAS
jgi:hypothetical protein